MVYRAMLPNAPPAPTNRMFFIIYNKFLLFVILFANLYTDAANVTAMLAGLLHNNLFAGFVGVS